MLNRPSLLLLIVPFLAAPPAAGAQRLERTPAHPTRDQIEAQLGYRTGRVTLPGGLATLDLPADFRYLDAEDTEIVLRAWGNPPDSGAHKLYWAKDLKFADESLHTLNYSIRVLGRRGVLVLNAVASMDQLRSIKRDMAKVIGFVEFNGGHRYADFIPGTDKVAEYGIAALIAGSLAAKAGVFKLLLGALLALKKLIVVAAVGVAAFLRKLFRRAPADAS